MMIAVSLFALVLQDRKPDVRGLRAGEADPPGPSNITVARNDGRRALLELNLRDGERRSIELR